MKHLIWIGAVVVAVLLFVFFAGNKEEATVAPAEETQVLAEQVDESLDDASTAVEETSSDTLEVVEESASEAEPADEAIVLAVAETASAPREWQFKEGEHYVRMVPTQPTVGGADKIEVAEFFWYGCPHCYDLEPFINDWVKDKDPGVRFVRVPATWNTLVRLHGQLYYTEEVLVRNGVIKDSTAFRDAIFQEYHRRGNRMTSEDAIKKLFVRFGVSEDQFQQTWSSFEVNQKLRVADDLARRYSIASVPAIVVNGKYRAGAAEAGSYSKLMELVDELTVREGLR